MALTPILQHFRPFVNTLLAGVHLVLFECFFTAFARLNLDKTKTHLGHGKAKKQTPESGGLSGV